MDTDMLTFVLAVVAAGAAVLAAVLAALALAAARGAARSAGQLGPWRADSARESAALGERVGAGFAGAQAETRSGLESVRSELRAGVEDIDRRLAQMSEQTGAVKAEMADLRTQMAKELGDTKASQEKRFSDMQQGLATSMRGVQDSVSRQLSDIRQDNSKSLEQIRSTVEEKLQKTLDERISQSFKLVNDQLDSVSRGLGEMRGMAQNVGDLKRVLTNVKARGIVGEVQLGAILEEILSPKQYDTNVATVPGSSERVEFAVKIPGKDGEFAYLPIDSKFPADTYEHLQDAKESGDPAAVEAAWKELEARLRDEARDVSGKYVAPPDTTSFAIIFLPFEGLYAEVVGRAGLIERLQREFRVNVAGPSTMAALLNSLQMGFQTVAIQKRADEIQRVLVAVKAELPKYKEGLLRAQKQLRTASKTIDTLVGTRTRAMERTLRGVTEQTTLEAADEVLGIEAADEDDAADVEQYGDEAPGAE